MSWIIVGAAAVGATLAVKGAQDQNRAARRSMSSANDSARISLTQQRRASALETQRTINDSRRIAGRLRVAAGEAGIEEYGAGQRANLADTGLNTTIIAQNRQSNQMAIYSQLLAQQVALKAQQKNPILAGILGGIQGASVGVGITGIAGAIGGAFAPSSATLLAGIGPVPAAGSTLAASGSTLSTGGLAALGGTTASSASVLPAGFIAPAIIP